MTWEPIETAPKDGSGIIVIDMAAEDPEAGGAYWHGGVWSVVDPCDDPDQDLARAIYWESPTHWMPLPDPPAKQTSIAA